MLAVVPSATLHGLDGRSIRVEVDVAPGLPGFTRRRARRHGGPGGARTRPRRDPQRRLRLPTAAHHGQPRAGRAAQDRRVARPGDRHRHPARVRAGARRHRSPVALLGELGLDGEVRLRPGHPADGRRRRGAARSAGSWSRRPPWTRRASSRGSRSSARRRWPRRPRSCVGGGRGGRRSRCRGSRSPGRARGTTPGRRPSCDLAGPKPAGPRRGPWAGRGAAGARDRARRRARAAADRSARRGQDHAGADDPRPAAAARRRGGARRVDRRVGGRGGPDLRAASPSRRSGRRTTRCRTPRWSAAARRCPRARSPGPTTASCSWTSWPSSTATCSRRSVSRSRRDGS